MAESYPLPLPAKLASCLAHSDLVAVTVIAVTACSSNPADAPPPTIAPATAAISPPVDAAPDGLLRPLTTPALTSTFDGANRTLVVLSGPPGAPSTITTFPANGPVRSVALPSPAVAMTGDGKGTVYLATRGGYLRFDVAGGSAERIDVAGQETTEFTAITRRGDGRIVLGGADGGVYTLAADNAVSARLAVFARVDGLVSQGDTVVVLDRSQTSVTTVDASGTKAAARVARGRGCHHDRRRSGRTGAGGRHPWRTAAGVRLRSADVAPALPGAGRPVRPRRLTGPRVGVGDRNQQRGWLRSRHRHSRREGALSNRATTELPGLRRRDRHALRGLGLGGGCASDRRGGAP